MLFKGEGVHYYVSVTQQGVLMLFGVEKHLHLTLWIRHYSVKTHLEKLTTRML